MRTVIPVVAAVFFVAATAAGQVPPGAWMSWILGTGQPSCQVCVYDTSGSTAAGFTANLISTIVTAKHPSGTVAISDSSAGTISLHTTAGSVWSFSAPLTNNIAVLPSGDLIGLSGALLAPATMRRYSIAGNVVWSVTLNALWPIGIRSDGAGNSWVIDGVSSSGLEYVNANGTRFGPFPIPGLSGISDFDVDAQGDAWVLRQGTTAMPNGTLMRFDTTGALTQSITIGSIPMAFTLDACGRPHVLLDAALPQTIAVIDPATGGTLATTTLSTTSRYESITIDPTRNYWLSSTPAGFAAFDETGTLLATFVGTGAPNAANRGDPTGLRLCSVIDPLGDADGDGIPNRRELELGYDPINAASSPPSLGLTGLVAGGSTFSISVTFPGAPGSPYLSGVSGGNSGIPLPAPDCRVIPLDQDPLLTWWLGPSSGSIATGVSGALDATGTGTFSATLPAGVYGNLPLYVAFGAIDPLTLGLTALSQELMIVVP